MTSFLVNTAIIANVLLCREVAKKEWLAIAYGHDHGCDKLICLSPALLQIPMDGLLEAHVIRMSNPGKVIDINPIIVQASNTL